MPELAQDIFPFVRYPLHEERESREKRRAVENLTKVGSFDAHSIRQILEPAKSEQKEPREIPRYVFQGFGVGGGSVLDVSQGSSAVSRITEVRFTPLQGEKVLDLLSREAPPDLIIMDLKLPILEVKDAMVSLLSRENVFNASLFPIVTPRFEGPEVPVRQVHSIVEGEEIYVHPLRSFAADPIPTIRRSIHLKEEIKSAIPPDDVPRQLSVRVNEEAE
jgi:hypothetical protein